MSQQSLIMMRVLMARQRRKPGLEVEAACWRLLQSGVGTVEACRQLGIDRKTGYRWRSENGGLPPEPASKTVGLFRLATDRGMAT